jgi:O-antigen ligase
MSGSEARGFFVPLGIHANDLGRLFAVAYALVLFSLTETRDGGLRLLFLGTIGLIVLALTLTFSRGAFFGFIVVNLIFLATRRNATAIIIGLLALGALALAAPAAVYERLATGMDGDLNAISAGRVDEIWLPLLPEVLHSPVWGNGLGSILWSAPQKSGRILEVTHPHNAYLQAILDMGFVGFGLLVAFFRHVWRTFRSHVDNPNLSPLLRGFHRGAMAGLASFLAAGFAGSSLYPCFEQVFIWFSIGVAYGLCHRQQEGVQQ